ncbi:hypothetical protein LTR53_016600 [Teratosphaeriaceae sp. CCFEE 6253]|nr:hypothetical protein LTR53_016600 [Teratosphaeriaceae sp. CCFEE 6253]
MPGVSPMGMGMGMAGAQRPGPFAMNGFPGSPAAGLMPPGFGALGAQPRPRPGPGMPCRPPPPTPADVTAAWADAHRQTMATGDQYGPGPYGLPARLRPGHLARMAMGGPGMGPGGMGAGGPGMGMGVPPGGMPGAMGGMGPKGMGGGGPGGAGLGPGGAGGGFDARSGVGY